MKRLLAGVVIVGISCVSIASSPYYSGTPAVVPIYTAVHGQAQTNDELVEAINKLTASVDKLNATLEAVAASPQAPPPPGIDALTVAKNACLACHGPSTSAKGFDFALFADDAGTSFAPLNNRDRQRVRNRVSDGSMPPPKHPVKLTDAERKALSDYFKQ